MQNQTQIKFFFKENIFIVPVRFDILGSMNHEIASALFTDRQYEIQSKVSLETIQAFIDYWENHSIPDINAQNVEDFEHLNDELQITMLTQLIESRRDEFDEPTVILHFPQREDNLNKRKFEERIATNLDFYVKERGQQLITLKIQTLYNIFNHPNRVFHEHNLAYELIRHQYEEMHNVNIFFILKFLDFDQLTPENQRESLAKSDERFENIPNVNILKLYDTINEQKEKYQKIYKLLLLNQEISTKEKFMKKKSSIEKCCENEDVTFLQNIIFPKIKINDNICFRLNPIDFTAELFSSSCDDDIVAIPRSIQYQNHEYTVSSIGRWSFRNSKTKSLTFPAETKVTTICTQAFALSSLQQIFIPASVSVLEEGWCDGMPSKINLSFSPNNPYFVNIDGKLILGKSIEKSDDYDIIYYAYRDIEAAIIPSSVKRINSFCFNACTKLERVDFEENSQLVEIGKSAFSFSSIYAISVPKHVTLIDDNCFEGCKNLVNVEFDDDSMLNFIGKSAFKFTSLLSFSIPSNVITIGENAFAECRSLDKVTIQENSKLRNMGNDIFKNTPLEKIVNIEMLKDLQNKKHF